MATYGIYSIYFISFSCLSLQPADYCNLYIIILLINMAFWALGKVKSVAGIINVK